ncbi:MAG: type VI secretion system tip protein VgrG, partial [Bilophila sp.]
LPEHASCSGLLTRSFPDGENGNELRFDDKKDEELVYLHAQKKMTCDIEHARTVTILGEGGDALTLEKSSRITTFKEGNDSLNLEKGNRKATINGDDTLKVTGKRYLETNGDEKRKYNGNVTLNIKGDYTLKVSGNLTLEAGGMLKLR